MQLATSSSTDGAQARKQTYVITRRFHANIRGSFNLFASSGEDAASWSPVEGKSSDVFGVSEIFSDAPDVDATSQLLSNAVLHRVTVLETKNKFPLPLGVTISCCPSDETTRTGHKYALTTLADSHNSTPLVVFEAEPNSNEGMQWRSEYPDYNSNNLETHGVLNVQGEGFVFVSQHHPVIALLKKNVDVLNADITQQPLIDGEWYKVAKQVMAGCCQQLRERVLKNVSARDLNNFSLQIHRLGNKEWTDFTSNSEIMSILPDEMSRAEHNGDQADLSRSISHILAKPYDFSARIEVTYEVNV